jgi:hypothetical protein
MSGREAVRDGGVPLALGARGQTPGLVLRGGPLMEPPVPRVRIDGKQAVIAAK